MGLLKNIFKKKEEETDAFYKENQLIDNIYKNISPDMNQQTQAIKKEKSKNNKDRRPKVAKKKDINENVNRQKKPVSNGVNQKPAQNPFRQQGVNQQPAQNPFRQQNVNQQPAQDPFRQQGVNQQPAQDPFRQQNVNQQPAQDPFRQQNVHQQPAQNPFKQQNVNQQPAQNPFVSNDGYNENYKDEHYYNESVNYDNNLNRESKLDKYTTQHNLNLVNNFNSTNKNRNIERAEAFEEEVQNKEIELKQHITMLFSTQLPIIDERYLQEAIMMIEQISTDVYVTVEHETNTQIVVSVEFENHKIKLRGLDAKFSEKVIRRTIQCSNITDEEMVDVSNHISHINCYYEGDCEDLIESYIALYKVAYAFINLGLIGVLNEEAWICQSVQVLRAICEPKILDAARRDLLVTIWTNSIKMPVEEGVWIFTKGNHLFGVKDFAYLGNAYDVDEMNEIFTNMFKCIYNENWEVKPGDSVRISEGLGITFKDVYREREYIEGPIGTLVMEKVYM